MKQHITPLLLAWAITAGAKTAGTAPRDLHEAIRKGDLVRVQMLLAGGADPNSVDAGGTPALINATLYGNAQSVRMLLDRGAKPNLKDALGATALIVGAGDPEKARLLIQAGADVNAASASGRTAMHVAASTAGGAEAVKLMLEKGARVNVRDNISPIPVLSTGGGKATPLIEAGRTGDLAAIRMLLAAGAHIDEKDDHNSTVLSEAVVYGRRDVVKWLLDSGASVTNRVSALETPILSLAAARGDTLIVKMLIVRGAQVNVKDKMGATPLMWAALSDYERTDLVAALIAAGADKDARDASGATAFDVARRRGAGKVARMLAGAGNPVEFDARPIGPQTGGGGDVKAALALLGKSAETSTRKTGCATCHHHTLPLVAMGAARRKGIAVDDTVAKRTLYLTLGFFKPMTQIMVEGTDVVPDLAVTGSYFLEALASQNEPAGRLTAAVVHNIALKQTAEGNWVGFAPRPPLESGDIQATAMAIRALQLYPLPGRRVEMRARIHRASLWLRAAHAVTTEERTMKLLGLRWAGRDPGETREAARVLVMSQRPNGGWAQLPTMPTDAYATGKALYALRAVFGEELYTSEFARGIRYLRATQQTDGSWVVKTRLYPFQPLADTGFPHGRNQWISAAGTSWASIALAMASAPEKPLTD